ncbi:hypothetical protein ABGB14_27285 [Nonomuraea sp. B10E15]|uniref:hypothetical protein n=1 Tax=Nonomuraea sp. B10E15 TaxID=3153560 RepID=UPI00325F7AC1
MATSPARTGRSRRPQAPAPVQPSGRPVSWVIAFMSALVTYPIFVDMLLPQGYSLWAAVAVASAACLGAGRATRMMAFGPARQGAAGAVLTPSFLARVATLVIRAAVTPRPQDNDPPDGAP